MKKALGVIAASLLLAAPVLADTPAPDGGVTMTMKGITVNVGGFIEAASIYRSRNDNNDVASQFSTLPLSNSAGYYQDETRFSARQSRISLLAKGDYDQDTHLAGYYEMDFLGAATTSNSKESNSYVPRVRHLYTTIDWDNLGLHLLAGQTWSLVTMNGEGIIPRKEVTPLTIDAQYVPGFTWARQPQFRIVKDFGKTFWLGLSVENSQTTTGGTSVTTNAADANYASQPTGGNFASTVSTSAYPDFVVKAAVDPGWGHFEVYDLIRIFESDLKNTTGGFNSTLISTNAVGAGVILPLIPNLKLQLSGIYGKGIGRYGSAQFADVTQDTNGANSPLTESQLLAGLTYEPTSAWSLYGYYGQEQVQRQILTVDNSGTGLPVTTGYGIGNANIQRVSQGTAGAWYKFYQGRMGKMQAGLQLSHTEDKYFAAASGVPLATDNMVYTSLRYYWQ